MMDEGKLEPRKENILNNWIRNVDSEQLNSGVDRGGFGPAPFDESSTGDCILQTSDGVQYKAHRTLLALASPVFRDM